MRGRPNTMAITPINAVKTKIARQLNASISAPASNGPNARPMPNVVPSMLYARVRA